MRTLLTMLAVMFFAVGVFAGELAAGFKAPPLSAWPQTWWHWLDGNISREGIKADLTAMKKAGIGGATILDISGALPPGPVKTLSPEWFALLQYALEVAADLGLEISVHNCPGWSSSGGPWIKPEQAMKKLVWSETLVAGGGRISTKLAQPATNLGFYRDIAVQAYPSIAGDGYRFAASNPSLTASFADEAELTSFMAGKGILRVPRPTAATPQHITFAFAEPLSASTMSIDFGGSQWHGLRVALLLSEDGETFREHTRSAMLRPPQGQVAFPTLHSRFVRLQFLSISEAQCRVSRISFSPGSRISNIAGKSFASLDSNFAAALAPDASSIIARESILDLSDKLSSDGSLDWDAPAGQWTLLRFGYTLTGRKNHPTTPEGSGLECDKLAKSAVKQAWDGMMGRIVANAGSLAGKSLVGALIDSYEVGAQNWTDSFREDFIRLRAYDPLPLLSIVTGRYVDSAEYSERFLQDFRRSLSELYAECYADYFAELAHSNGLKFASEPYGGPFDNLLQGRSADLPMAEFWGGDSNSTGNASLAATIAHVNGRVYAGAESFTATPRNGRWQSHPAAHKAQGDRVFSQGVNRFIFHSYAHQPWTVKSPGMTMGQWGFHFNRHNSLWNSYGPWLNYIQRAQYMLQQGRFVADALYVARENTPSSAHWSPSLPEGYRGDCCDARSLIEQVTVRDGRVLFPHGMSYAVLVASQTGDGVTPALLRKLLALAQDGATILLGQRPQSPLGLSNYPDSDGELAALSEELWGDLDGKQRISRTLGRGRVYYGVSMQGLFANLDLAPDMSCEFAGRRGRIVWLHRRRNDGADIYFVSNQQASQVEFTGVFRVSGCLPELWDAESGSIQPAPAYREEDGLTRVPLRLDGAESLFVVFRPGSPQQHVVSYEWRAAGDKQEKVPALIIDRAEYQAVTGGGRRDVTDVLRGQIKNGFVAMEASNSSLGGDPTPMRLKQLVLDYRVDGKAFHKVVPENGYFELPEDFGAEGALDYRIGSHAGRRQLMAWTAGTYTEQDNLGNRKVTTVEAVPAALALEGPWEVHFPAGLGAPSSLVFPKLRSYTEHDDPGVKYFSGTASYRKAVRIPPEALGGAMTLELGVVRVMARVLVNGQDLGILWWPPYRVEVGEALRVGENQLEIQVTNRWVNRLIGDEQLPDDAEWRAEGSMGGRALKAWPQWFLDGQASPSGRIAFTTYKHWYKDDPLLEAGLLGPVRLCPAVLVDLE